MASLSLIHHHNLNVPCALQSTTAESYDDISEQSTAHEETWGVKQESQLSFEAWRLGVETNTLRTWTLVSPEFLEYVENYMVGSGSQYVRDSQKVANESMAYVNSLKLSGDGRDAWVFDVDETLLSNLPFFERRHYGPPVCRGEGVDHDAFIKWADLAEAPPLPASRSLYVHLLELGFKIFLLTGRYDYERNATEKNLARAGYHSWEALLLREPEDYEKRAVDYKSERRLKIEQDGCRILGNSGDQWSDLAGYTVGHRTFKLPNPMCYIA